MTNQYDERFARKPFEADHEHKFSPISRYLEACVAGDGCRLGRIRRDWIDSLTRKDRDSSATDRP